MYISVEMLGSPNAGYFTYDGDQSGQPNPDVPSQSVPAGSAGVERALAGYLNLAGVRPADMPPSRTTDYGPVLAARIPVGRLTAGSSQRKNEVQARRLGVRARGAVYPHYHTR